MHSSIQRNGKNHADDVREIAKTIGGQVTGMSCDRNKCYKQEYNGEGCDTCDNNIEDMIKALRCLGSVYLYGCYMKQYNQKHPNDMIYCEEGSCPHYQETYGVCFGYDDTSWLVLAADELERLSGEQG